MTALPLVMVHGFMGGGAQWDVLRQDFQSGYKLVTPNLPGFSDNASIDAPDSIAGFAHYVLDWLDNQNIERFILLGHSMGGMIVQEMTALAPERIERLILYGTAASGNLPGRFETFETSKRRIQKDGVSASAKRISATWFFEKEAAERFGECAAIAECSSMQALMAGLDAMQSWSRSNDLERISCPTLIIWGERDRTYRWPQIDQLWKTIPDSSLAVMPGCSHAAHLEKPDLFSAILKDFLSS